MLNKMNCLDRYSVDYANTDPEKQFKVHAANGLVSVRNALDRETLETHTVHILAIDKGTSMIITFLVHFTVVIVHLSKNS